MPLTHPTKHHTLQRYGSICGLVLTLVLLGCPSAVYRHTPETKHLVVADPYDHAWQKALRALATMGAETHQQDRQSGSLQAKVHNAVLLHVLLQPDSPTATRVTVAGSVLPNKVVLGKFTEVDDFLRTYQRLQ